MSKGLEALENIMRTISYEDIISCEEEIKAIGKELKRLEELDNGAYVPVHINRYNELCDKEKALEIIKNKNVNVHYLLECRFEDYNDLVEVEEELTKEEYDLLKGVLL